MVRVRIERIEKGSGLEVLAILLPLRSLLLRYYSINTCSNNHFVGTNVALVCVYCDKCGFGVRLYIKFTKRQRGDVRSD